MNITIVGGGFGGVKAALELARDKANQITLVSDRPDFQYYPALYSTATGHSATPSWIPLGTILADIENVNVTIDRIKSIDVRTRVLDGTSGTRYAYQMAILAMGSVTTYFGIKGLDVYAYGIKSAEEIERLKQHLYTDLSGHQTHDKHYVIIGGGPTGVELAALLGTYLNRLSRKYKVRSHKIRIHLIEAAPRILPRMGEAASRRVMRRLTKLGVNVQTGKKVEEARSDELIVNGKALATRTVIWTSGVATPSFYKEHPSVFKLAPNGKVIVDETLRAAPHVYVIGDNAATPYSGLAQTALSDAGFIADNFYRHKAGKPLRAYKSSLPAVVVPVGENWAVFEYGRFRLYGRLAAWIRKAADLIGYRDILPLRKAVRVWDAEGEIQDDYFTPRV